MKENPIRSLPGIPLLLLLLAVLVAGGYLIFLGAVRDSFTTIIVGGLVIGVGGFLMSGLYMVEPNQAAVLSLFGKYIGTDKDNGLRWNNPFFSKKKVSQRVRNFESGKLKVNELDGSPIEIAAVIVWQVVDSAEAVYNVDDYESFVHIQTESALRTMATSYPYDQHEDGQVALRSHAAEISQHLEQELSERLADAGVQVLNARISHLAYAPEIAHAMLQR
ncbi:MAG: SPFH domain-containing protein, partial [Lysobacterales bacterium]